MNNARATCFAIHNLDHVRGFFVSDVVFRPTALVQRKVKELAQLSDSVRGKGNLDFERSWQFIGSLS